ncbi:MAG: sensor domain-containing diguanylate cyclase [Cyanobacteriota bacterium]|nr:sensor domain-containing diguanylate cyclase [Cyanobacteriota bacterium]
MPPFPDYPVPTNESHRLRELERYGLDDGTDDPHLCRILALTTDVLEMPIGLVSLVEDRCQRFLCRHGLEARSTPREMAFCAHAIASEGVFVVPDALEDERFSGNPLVLGPPQIRFYAGCPLATQRGYNLGTLCVIDTQPRGFSAKQQHRLGELAAVLMREIEWRHQSRLCPLTGLQRRDSFFDLAEKEFKRAKEQGWPLALLSFDVDNFRQINMRWGHASGDQVLVDLVALCQSMLDEDDLMARIYDEEFCLLIVGKDDAAALALAELVRLSVTQMHGVFSTSEYRVCISGGISSLGATDRSFADLYGRAEQALLLAKNNGRNQIARLLAE